MKRMFVFVSLIIAMLSLTSCLTYTGNKFTPASSEALSPAPQKAFLEEVTLSMDAATWVTLNKQRQSGRSLQYANVNDISQNQATYEDCQEIAKYISAAHPEIFSDKKEGAIPVRLEIDGQKMEIGHSTLMAMISGLTFGIIPSGIYNRQSINILAETLEDSPKKGNQGCSLEVTCKNGLILSPFVWIGAAGAHSKSFGMLSTDDMWQNYFKTSEFAASAALAVDKVLKQK